jgi:Zn-dependent protease with chaperone function/predicted RNA-binding Zn-ribbon protein involved in translation (DUF1610 family)
MQSDAEHVHPEPREARHDIPEERPSQGRLVNVISFCSDAWSMSESAHAKCSCAQCNGHLEFPVAAQGSEILCPHCGEKTILLAQEEPRALPPGTELSPAVLASAFAGPISPPRSPLLYLIGLFLVAGMMVLLPLFYLALIGLAGWLTYEWAIHAKEILPGDVLNLFAYLIVLTLYLAPLFAGTVLVLFMVKPFFARRAPHAQPLALHPGAEPLLHSFVSQICRAVRAPCPARIDIDCQLNAGAGFRRGILSFLQGDLVLTLGAPLIAGLDLDQFAAVIGHELGHFSQGFGMRLNFLIRQINGWFVRAVYQRDAWDLALEDWGQIRHIFIRFIVACARLGVWLSRQVLRLAMLASHAICCFMMRQQEFHADAYAIQLAGSAVFESQTFRLNVLQCALENAYSQMREAWKRQHALPADFPAYLIAFDQAMPSEIRTRVQDTLGLATTGLFALHPSPGDRIRRARQQGTPGVFRLPGLATTLFSNFEILSRQVTLLHYSDDLRLPLTGARFYSLANPSQPVEPQPSAADQIKSSAHDRTRVFKIPTRSPAP